MLSVLNVTTIHTSFPRPLMANLGAQEQPRNFKNTPVVAYTNRAANHALRICTDDDSPIER